VDPEAVWLRSVPEAFRLEKPVWLEARPVPEPGWSGVLELGKAVPTLGTPTEKVVGTLRRLWRVSGVGILCISRSVLKRWLFCLQLAKLMVYWRSVYCERSTKKMLL
jgi:hypothetical protein